MPRRIAIPLLALLIVLLPLHVARAATPATPDGTWRLFKDSDGKVPRSGAVIELTLKGGRFTLRAQQPDETVTDEGTYAVSGRRVTFSFSRVDIPRRSGPWSVSSDTLVLPFLALGGEGEGTSTWMTPAAIESFLAKVPRRPSGPETMPALLARMQQVAESYGNAPQRDAIDRRAKGQAAKYRGGEAEALYAQGAVYFLKGYYREAWYAFARAAVLQPANAVYLTNLATVLQEIGPAQEARTLLEWVTRNYPNLDPPFGSLGTACAQLGDLACARTALGRARTLAPENGLYDYGLARVAEREKRADEAQALYRSAFDKGYARRPATGGAR